MRIVERISLRHFSGKYREAEGAPGSLFKPGSWVDVSFCEVRYAGGTEALLRQRRSAFYYVQLLSAAAVVEDGACARPLRGRVGENARRNEVSSTRLCGDAGARAFIDERAHAWNAFHRAAETEATRGAETAQEGTAGCTEQMRLPFAEAGEPLRAFWQARFYDFNVYSRGKVNEKLNYMHANPVIRRLVKHPRDWRWSSWGFYFGGGTGLVAIDVEE